MTNIYQENQNSFASQSTLHPLDPLTAQEITAAVKIIRTEKKLGEGVRFVSVSLKEPAKDVVVHFKTGDAIVREAAMVLLDNERRATYETVVSITASQVVSWRHIPGVQPAIRRRVSGAPCAWTDGDPSYEVREPAMVGHGPSVETCYGEILTFHGTRGARGDVT